MVAKNTGFTSSGGFESEDIDDLILSSDEISSYNKEPYLALVKQVMDKQGAKVVTAYAPLTRTALRRRLTAAIMELNQFGLIAHMSVKDSEDKVQIAPVSIFKDAGVAAHLISPNASTGNKAS